MSQAYRLMCCAQVAGILLGSAEATGRALDSDCIVEPVRGPLIPGFAAVKRAAKAAGMLGASWWPNGLLPANKLPLSSEASAAG